MTSRSKLASMVRSRPIWHAFIAVLCFAVFATGVNGDHWHLCFDGSGGEPLASIHHADGGAHHVGDDGGTTHNYVDLSVAGDTLVHKVGHAMDLLASIATVLVLCLLVQPRVVRLLRERDAPIDPFPDFRILPPLRAPPR
jgi:hypothetical protein